MSDTTSTLSACPACVAAPAAMDAARVAEGARIVLSVPEAHCAACISTIERDLETLPGIDSARLNLTLRRVSVAGSPDLTPEAVIARLKRLGYAAHELDPGTLSMTETDRQARDLMMRLGVAGFSMMNVMLLSVAVWSGATDATRDLFHMTAGLIAVPTVIFSAQPFFKSAWASLRAGRLGMDVPISLAIILATLISIYETWQSGPHAYFDGAVSLTFFLLAGRYLDFRSRAAARSAAQELAALEVPRAIRLDAEGGEETVMVADVRPGDVLRVRPGGRIPVDGEVVAGASELDRSILTGETLPVAVAAGVAVGAGAVNLTGPLDIRVTAAGKDSSLHRMADLVAVAESARNRYTALAERASRGYAPVVHILAFSAFAAWYWITGGDFRIAINIAAATLIITCPCALGLAVPAVVTAASGRLFRKGLLIKDGTALERLAEVDTVAFDKTGTLTMGAPEPQGLDRLPRDLVAVAAALAGASSHPLARALAEGARKAGISPADVAEIREVPGYGIEGQWQGARVRLGRAAWVGAEAAETTATYLCAQGRTLAIPFADRLRPGAEEAVAAFRRQGKAVHLISGDVPAAVAEMAARLGIADWQAEALPEDKARVIDTLQAKGRKVLMVGDGLNDTVALAAAHVSVSPATALDAARVASDIVLLGQDLAPIAGAQAMAVTAVRRIRENFVISFGYNVVAVPIALLGYCTPLWAAVAMSVSSITVVLNALRLKG